MVIFRVYSSWGWSRVEVSTFTFEEKAEASFCYDWFINRVDTFGEFIGRLIFIKKRKNFSADAGRVDISSVEAVEYAETAVDF